MVDSSPLQLIDSWHPYFVGVDIEPEAVSSSLWNLESILLAYAHAQFLFEIQICQVGKRPDVFPVRLVN